jgi:peptidoglycan/LPS O-acetylase OafA/YrhL
VSATASQAHGAFLRTRHFGSLDGIRCFSILAVVWHHTDHSWVGARWAGRGFLGVDMFFVLSGFLIVTLILREKERTGTVSLKDFYVRRTLRIFPIYYGLLLGLAAVYLLLKPHDDDTRALVAKLPFYLLYLCNFLAVHANNLAITWSLATEEQFYMLWPTVEKVIRGSAIFWVLGAVLLLNQLVNFGVADPLLNRVYSPDHHPEILDVTFTPIALGVLLAHVLHRPKGFAIVHRLVGSPWSSPFAACALGAALIAAPADIAGWPRLLIQLLMTLLLASVVLREDHRLSRPLSWKPIVRIGVVSYGMYLFHMLIRHAVLAAMRRAGLEGIILLDFVLVSLATWLFAEVSFHFYEKRFLALKKKFERPRIISSASEPVEER